MNLFPKSEKESSDTVMSPYNNTLFHLFTAILCILIVILFPSQERKHSRFIDIPNYDICYTLEPNLSRRYKHFGGFYRDIDKGLLNCQLELDPGDNDPKILVLGTSGMIGMAVEQEIKARKLKYIAIKSRLHIDILNPVFPRFLSGSNIYLVINCANNSKEHIESIKAATRGAPIISFVRNFDRHSDTEIFVPNVFGPQIHRPVSSIITRNIYHCIIHGGAERLTDDVFVYSKDLAKYTLDIVQNTTNFTNNNFDPDIPTYTGSELYNYMAELMPTCKIDTNQEVLSEDGRIKLKETYDYVKDRLDKVTTEPYITYITTISHHKPIIERFKQAYSYNNWLSGMFYDSAYEFIVIYAPMEPSPKFEELVQLPEPLKSHTRVLEVDYRDVIKMRDEMNSSFPDFPLRNLGVRNARSEFIITGTSDVTLPPGFFEIAHCKCLARHEWIRTIRLELANTTVENMRQSLFVMKDVRQQFQFFINIPHRLWFDSVGMEASGDFEGGDKKMWELVNGFLQNGMNWNVDTVLSFDWAANLCPQISIMLPAGYHMSHNKTSHLTRGFDLFEPNVYYRFMHGRATKLMKEYRRPTWGRFNFKYGNYSGWKIN